MFKFKATKNTYSDPVSATFKPGIPFGRKYSAGDICLIHEGFQASKVFLNSKILRSALLNSKEFLEKALEISIKDIRKQPKEIKKENVEVIEADVVKAAIPKSGKELVLESEELILDSKELIIEDKKEEVIVEKKTKKTSKK